MVEAHSALFMSAAAASSSDPRPGTAAECRPPGRLPSAVPIRSAAAGAVGDGRWGRGRRRRQLGVGAGGRRGVVGVVRRHARRRARASPSVKAWRRSCSSSDGGGRLGVGAPVDADDDELVDAVARARPPVEVRRR